MIRESLSAFLYRYKISVYSDLVYIFIMHFFAILSSYLGSKVGTLRRGWMGPIWRLIVIVLAISAIFIVITPIDPLDLSNKTINISSKDGPAYDLLINTNVYLNNDRDSFADYFSEKDAFGILLSDPAIFPNALNNETLVAAIMDGAVFKKISSDQNIFNITFSNQTIFYGALSNNTALKRLNFNNITYINISTTNGTVLNVWRNISSSKSLKDSALKQAFDDFELRQIFFLEGIKDKIFRLNLMDNLSENEDLKKSMINLIFANANLRDSSLKEIYENNQSRKEAFLLIKTNKELRAILFRTDYKYLLYFITILWIYWQQFLAIWILIEIILRLSSSRRSLAISEFYENTDKSATDQNKDITTGLATLLAVRLGRLNQLYRQVDEGRQISSVAITSNPVPAVIESKEIPELASNIIADDSKLAFGPFSIPGKLINGLIDAMIKRPKLSGGLHKSSEDKDFLVLTASLSGWTRPLSWRVDGREKSLDVKEDSAECSPDKRTKDDMVTELACRIFTDLTFDEGQIIPWKATWYFTEGVRCYRDSLHGHTDRLLKLHQAVKCFLETQFQDEDFPWAHYNLGVVYSELKQYESAKQAFQRSISLHPGKWQSCYALALLNYLEYENECDETISLCEKALYLKPDRLSEAKVHNLLGLAWKKKEKGSPKIWENLAEGVISSLWGLIKAECRGKRQDEAKSVVSKCYSDLASFGIDIDINKTIIKRLIRSAIRHSPNDPYLHYRLASINDSDPEEAMKQLNRSSCPSSTEYWADVAALCIKHYKEERDEERIERAIKAVLNDFSDAKLEDLHKIIKSIETSEAAIPAKSAVLQINYHDIKKCLIELYEIKNFNSHDAKTDEYSDLLQNWKTGKEKLSKLWLERDSPCMYSIKEELRKISDEKSISENLFRIQIKRDLDGHDPIESLRKTALDFNDSFSFHDIEKDIGKLNEIKSGKECDGLFRETIRDINLALISFCLKEMNLESIVHEIEASSSAKRLRKTLKICRELKYSYMMRDLGDIYYICGFDIASSEGRTPVVKKIYNNILNQIMICSRDEISHEYERFREDLRSRWDLNIEKSEFKRHQELSIKYPLSALHHKNMGRSHYRLNNFELARMEWKQALLLNPDDPKVRFNIGLTYIQQSSDLKIDSEIRKANYVQAKTYLKQALDLCEDTRCILKTYYRLGSLNYGNKDYDQAIACFKIAQSMSNASGLKEEESFIFKHYLSCAYYYLKRYRECEEELEYLINKDDKNYRRKVGRKLGNPILMGKIMILARLNLASSILQRDADLDNAEEHIDCARNILDKAFSGEEESTKNDLDAYWHDCRGWYFYKKYKSNRDINNSTPIIKIREIKGSRALIKTATIFGEKSGVGSSKIERANDKIILSDFKIENAEMDSMECENITLKNITIKSGLIKRASVMASMMIGYDELENNVVRSKENKGKYRAQICKYDSQIFNNNLYIESALIEKTDIYDFKIEDAAFGSAKLGDFCIESKDIDIEKSYIDRSIDCLQKSITLAADSSAYLHLALVYECKFMEEENPKKMDVWKNLALSSYQHSRDLDLNLECADELTKLKARLDGTKGEDKTKNEDGNDKDAKDQKAIVQPQS